MSAKTDVRVLIKELEKSLAVLDKMHAFYESYTKTLPPASQRTTENAIVLAEILTNFYTCLETIFLRISQFFENSLRKDRWHQDLLEKMTLSIENLREAVISDSAAKHLAEFLRFRHFRRYYFTFEYDPDRLEMLRIKYETTFLMVKSDLNRFLLFLDNLSSSSDHSPP